MASNKNTDAINQLLGTSGTSSVKKVSKADKPVAPAKEAKEKISAFSSVITESNALRLEQYLYWAPGKRKKQDVGGRGPIRNMYIKISDSITASRRVELDTGMAVLLYAALNTVYQELLYRDI
nr:hypothetical protein [Tanacetum cinerariifolium]